ncbi:MAG: exodeoxyribonuclease V subunit beta [Opitutales bacterium]|nr:exodeoxyribonuclease V subunit beta [Opitutales bacterium]
MSGLPAFISSETELKRGVTLLEASAGTGKTFALARIFLRLVAEQGLEVGKILTVTFTSAATEELRDRIRSLLVEAYETLQEDFRDGEDPTFSMLRNLDGVNVEECIRRIRLAIICFDESIISTIHGFCNRVLTENSFETHSLFEVELDKAADDLTTEGVEEYWRQKFASVHPVVAAAASTQKVKARDMAKFFNGLPRTQEYEIGFDQHFDGPKVQEALIHNFELLGSAWLSGKTEYSDYVSNCIGKNSRAHKNIDRHVIILNKVLLNNEPSPIGIEILGDIRASSLKAKVAFKDRNKPEFANAVESFWLSLERFGLSVRVECVRYLEAKISMWKAKRGLLSFDDLLSLTAKAVKNGGVDGDVLRGQLRASFDAALIDEFQDTDPVQFDIFRELFGKNNTHWLYLIGDPKQSIYRFRGADLEAYFDFAEKTKAVKYSLDTNYRTVTPLVESVNAFFDQAVSPFLHTNLPFASVNPNEGGSADKDKHYSEDGQTKPAFIIRELDCEKEQEPAAAEARMAIRKDMATEIHRILQNGSIGKQPVRCRDIAVLVRSNHEAREVWEFFRKQKLPAVVFTDLSLFEAPEARELLWVLEGLINSRSEKAIKRALATGLLGMTGKDFQLWQVQSGEWDQWVGRFRNHYDKWRKQGVYVALRELFRETKAISLNLRRPDGERRVTNFLHLAEVLHQANASNPLSPSSLVVWFRTRIEEKDKSSDEYQLRLESQSESIRILTVHKSKGLEYPIVFLPSLSFKGRTKGGIFSYHKPNGKLVVDLSSTADDEAKEKGQLEQEQEDARVLYVGLTRSASRCYIYHAPTKVLQEMEMPAQVRMMRSWCSQGQDCKDGSSGGGVDSLTGSGNSVREASMSWISSLEGKAEHQMFSANELVPHASSDFLQNTERVHMLEAEIWNKEAKIPSAKIVESFSGLSKQVGFDGRDLDGVNNQKDQTPDFFGAEESPIFEFPAGANAGNFMHDLFEHLTFSDSSDWETFIGDKLKQHQYDSRKWTTTILGMVRKVMSTELHRGFSLQKLKEPDRLEEMEFHFPMASGFLPDLTNSLPADGILKRYLGRLNEEDFRRITADGYLKGLIDLIFRVNGKYYLLDWKSNKLGGQARGFGQQEVENEMLTHHYVLQYHFYVVALHRFLRSRMQNYSYERNFGGVYYLFVRGMNPGSKSGIYSDLPDPKTIRVLEDFLVPKK